MSWALGQEMFVSFWETNFIWSRKNTVLFEQAMILMQGMADNGLVLSLIWDLVVTSNENHRINILYDIFEIFNEWYKLNLNYPYLFKYRPIANFDKNINLGNF